MVWNLHNHRIRQQISNLVLRLPKINFLTNKIVLTKTANKQTSGLFICCVCHNSTWSNARNNSVALQNLKIETELRINCQISGE